MCMCLCVCVCLSLSLCVGVGTKLIQSSVCSHPLSHLPSTDMLLVLWRKSSPYFVVAEDSAGSARRMDTQTPQIFFHMLRFETI